MPDILKCRRLVLLLALPLLLLSACNMAEKKPIQSLRALFTVEPIQITEATLRTTRGEIICGPMRISPLVHLHLGFSVPVKWQWQGDGMPPVYDLRWNIKEKNGGYFASATVPNAVTPFGEQHSGAPGVSISFATPYGVTLNSPTRCEKVVWSEDRKQAKVYIARPLAGDYELTVEFLSNREVLWQGRQQFTIAP